MNIIIQKFISALSEVKFVSDSYTEINNSNNSGEADIESAPLTKEEIQEVTERWEKDFDNFTKEIYTKSIFDNHSVYLVPVASFTVLGDNFQLYHFYLEVIEAISKDIDNRIKFVDKKQYLNELLDTIKQHQEKFISNNRSNLEHIFDNEPINLLDKNEPLNFWALTELYKRYFNALYNHVSNLHSLIHLSLDSLQVTSPVAKLVWIYEEKTKGVAFEAFFELLKDHKYIDNTTQKIDFINAFISKRLPFKKIIWLKSLGELNLLVQELIKKQLITPHGDKWEAAINTFKSKDGKDYKMDSLERVAYTK